MVTFVEKLNSFDLFKTLVTQIYMAFCFQRAQDEVSSSNRFRDTALRIWSLQPHELEIVKIHHFHLKISQIWYLIAPKPFKTVYNGLQVL